MSERMTQAEAEKAQGCWIDGHWGQYGAARLVQIAGENGWDGAEALEALERAARKLASMSPSAVEFPDDEEEPVIWDSEAAEFFLNNEIAPDGFIFGWHDGEFFFEPLSWWDEDDHADGIAPGPAGCE